MRQLIDKPQRQIRQRPDIEIDHRKLVGAIERRYAAKQAEARIVDHIFDLDILRLQRRGDDIAGFGLLQIAGDDDRAGRICRGVRGHDLVGEGFETVGAARHQRHACSAGGEQLGQFITDARRRAGYQSDTPGHHKISR